MAWRFWESKTVRVAREAARWRVDMEEPISQSQVDEFEAWLRADFAHQRAYEQFDALSAAGQRLPSAGEGAGVSTSRRLWPALGLTVMILMFVLGFALFARPAEPAFATVANRTDAVSTVNILGGSVATLDANSAIETASTAGTIRLLRGRVRLVVHPPADETVTIVAQATTIIAHDCVLDLTLIDGGVRIRLVTGQAVLTRRGAGGAQLALIADRPVSVREGAASPISVATDDAYWTLTRVGFDDAPLGRIVEAANATGVPKISVAEPGLAALRVTAVLDLRDTRALARKLAAALDLHVIDRGDHLVLSR